MNSNNIKSDKISQNGILIKISASNKGDLCIINPMPKELWDHFFPSILEKKT